MERRHVLGRRLAQELGPPGGRGLHLAPEEDRDATDAHEWPQGVPPRRVEPLHAAERADVGVVAANRPGVTRDEGQVCLRTGQGVPHDVVEHAVIRHAVIQHGVVEHGVVELMAGTVHPQPRILTDRQVTQPSSFSNSETSTSVTQ